MLECQICYKDYKHLSSHIWHKHKILSRDYKIKFGLPIIHPLIIPEISNKLKASVKVYRTFDTNFNTKKSIKNRFKRGQTKTKYSYRSPYSMRKAIEQITKVNASLAPTACLVCGIITKNAASHLYNKHRLIYAD